MSFCLLADDVGRLTARVPLRLRLCFFVTEVTQSFLRGRNAPAEGRDLPQLRHDTGQVRQARRPLADERALAGANVGLADGSLQPKALSVEIVPLLGLR